MKPISYVLLVLAVCFCGLAVQAKSVGGPVIPYGLQQQGGPGDDFFSRWVLGEPAAPMPPTSVCINEIDSDTPGSNDAAEFIEFSGTPNGSLDGFVVVLFNGANDLAYRAYDLDGFSLDANGFFLIGNSGVAGVDLIIPNGTIQNGADAVAIYDTTSFVILSFATTINLVDAIVYDTDDADDTGLFTGLGQTVQYNENENGLAETQSVSRSTDCGATIVTQNPTPNATNGMSTCPSFSGAPDNVSITNSSCASACTPAGGLITAPPGTPCPTGSTLQYQVNTGSWSSTVPTYTQNGPAQTIKTRCSCNSDNTMNSAESAPLTTAPGVCTIPTASISYMPNDSFCLGSNVTLTANGGVSYLWSNSETTASIVVSPPSSTTYFVTVTGANGCTATSGATVYPQTAISLNAPAIVQPTTCFSANGSITLSINGNTFGTTFTWTTPNGSGLTPGQQNQSNLTVGTYNVTVTSPYGCSAAASYTLNGPGACDCPTVGSVSAAPSPACVGVPVTLTASGLVNMASTFGIVFKSFAAATADPYTGGTVLATVANGALGGGGTTATETATFATGGSKFIYAILTPTPGNPACRPSATTTLIVDMTLPTITCPGNIAVANASGLCSATVSYTTPSGTDNCTGANTIQTLGSPSGSSFPVGATTNIFKVTDAAGNTATCAFAVSVTDTQLPTITCPGNIAVANASGLCSATVSYTTPSGTDNCTGANTIQTLGSPSGSSFPVGATTNIFKVTDAAGNTATCAFAVSVTDTQLPTITCPANIAVANASGLCSAVVSYTTPSGTDNCTGANTIQTLGSPSGSSFPVGATTNIFKVTDGAGNTATCAFAVSVTDTQLPTITCPANIAVVNASGLCSATVSYTTPSGTDNCTGANTIQTLGSPSGSSFPVGATTNIFKVTDAAGNTATCAFAVSVTDTQLPTITCPGNIAVANASGLCSATVSYTTPSGADNCTGANTIQTLGSPSGSSFPVGATTNIFKVTDGAGNTATCAFAVSVTDTQLPTITCPANIAVANASGLCSATVSYTTPSGTDNCTGVNTIQTLGSPSGSSFPVGATTNIFKVTDGAGNTATCAFAVSVTDTQLPTITCPANIAVANASGLCSAVVSYSTPVGADNCTGATTIQTLGSPSGASFPVGATTNIFKVTDGAGNTATCAFAVSVTDTQLPTITCPANIAVANVSGLCSAVVNYSTPVGTDNCSGATTIQTLGSPSGSSFPVGATTNTFRVTDGAGNTATCAFNITVTDTQAPTMLCKNVTLNLDAAGQATLTVSQVNNGSFDNCGIASFSLSQTNFTCANVGNNNVTLSGRDQSNNPGQCFAVVTVTDPILPIAKCKNVTANLGSNGTVTVAASAVDNGSSDNCNFSLLLTPNTFSCSNIGLQTVTLKATDGGGNTATCTARVTVKDLTGPTAKCKNPTIFLDDTGHATLTAAQVNNGSTDNCGIAVMSIDKTSFNCSEISATQLVILSMTDGTGNTSSCLSYVKVKDAIAPTPICENVTVSLGSNGKVTVYGANLADASTDNCSVWSYSPVAKIYTAANLGNNNLAITVKDWSGNAATCVSVVTVILPENSDLQQKGGDEKEAEVENFDFIIFPNPTSGDATMAFQLPAEQAFTVHIFDTFGRLIYSHKDYGIEGENAMPLRMGGLAPGVYLIDFQSENMKVQKRLVLQE